MEKTVLYVLYHAGCTDGFGAAWAIHRHTGDQTPDGEVKYLPQGHSNQAPRTNPEAELLIVDFSYPLETMKRLHRRHEGRVTLLDHHLSARNELEHAMPNCIFDMNESGATMAWEYAKTRWKGREPLPELLAYVRDQDLWKWEMPLSKEVSAAIESHKYSFRTWDAMTSPDAIEELKIQGVHLRRSSDIMVEKLTANAVVMEIQGYRVPAVNSPSKGSEIGNALLEKYPEAPFAATWATVPGPDGTTKERWSLRSRPDFDVTEVAMKYGGGGHPQAAGFIIETGTKPGI